MPENPYILSDDQKLIASILTGDKNAFGKLYDRYAPTLFGVICAITGDSKTSENILQQSFFLIWQNIKANSLSSGCLLTAMLTVARKLAKEYARAEQNNEASEIQKPLDNVGIKKYTSLETGKQSGFESKLMQLICIKGFTVEEILKELNISEAELKTKLKVEMDFLKTSAVK